MANTPSENAIAIGKQFWAKCAQLIEVYPHRPDNFSGDSEPVALGRQLKTLTTEVASAVCSNEHWEGSASVGKGNWTRVPWAAFFDSRETTSAQKGSIQSSISPVKIGLNVNGLGVAATEFKSNPESKRERSRPGFARRSRPTSNGRDSSMSLREMSRVSASERKLAAGYARGMVFERFVPLDELKANRDDLTERWCPAGDVHIMG